MLEMSSKAKMTVLYVFLAIAICGIITIGAVNISTAKNGNVSNAIANTASSCSLEESKPVLIISLNGIGAGDLCTKISNMSNGRYFAYYGPPPFNYTVICSVTVKKNLQYTVYDVVPTGTNAKIRYSYTSVCSLLQAHHRLIGEGF